MTEYKNGYWNDENDFEFRFVIDGPCAVLKNSKIAVRRGSRVILVSNKNALSWHNLASAIIQSEWPLPGPIDKNVTVEVQVVTYAHDRRRRDLDNSIQSPIDALQVAKYGPTGILKQRGGGVLSNDSQVKSVDGSRIRFDRKNPRVEITVRSFTDEEA